MSMMLLPILLVLLGAAFWAGRMSVGSASTPQVAPAAAPRELAERDGFIEQLREIAWQHRDVSPELSTIIIDEIATHHRRVSSGPDA